MRFKEESLNGFKALCAALALMLSNGLLPLAAQDLPAPIQALQKQGLKIVAELPTVSGLKAYAGYIEQQPYALYLTPDGKHVLVGSVFDSEGKNLTSAPLEAAIAKPMSEQTLGQLESSTWVAQGSAQAPRIIYTFTDPNCPYCHRFWEQSRPWVDAGKVQIRHILVGILRDTSAGKAAAILDSPDPSKALASHEQSMEAGGIAPLKTIPAKTQANLLANQALMDELGIQATPATFYLDQAGVLHATMGAPDSADLQTILGPR